MPIINSKRIFPKNSIYDLITRFGFDNEDRLTINVTAKRLLKILEKPLIAARVTWEECLVQPSYSYRTPLSERNEKDSYFFDLTIHGLIQSTKFTGMRITVSNSSYRRRGDRRVHASTPVPLDGCISLKENFLKTGNRIRGNSSLIYEFYDADLFDKIKTRESALHDILADFTLGRAQICRWWGAAPEYSYEDFCNKEIYIKNFKSGVRFIVSKFKNGNLRIDRYEVVKNNWAGDVTEGPLIRSKTKNILNMSEAFIRFPTNTPPIDVDMYLDTSNRKPFNKEVSFVLKEQIPPSAELLKELKNQLTLEIL